MKAGKTNKLQSLLLNILETTRELSDSITSDELKIEDIRILTHRRGRQMRDFGEAFVSAKNKDDIKPEYIESFTNIYKQILKNQQILDDTINRRLSMLKRQLVEIGRDKGRRSSYVSNQKHDLHGSSVLLTSKIHG